MLIVMPKPAPKETLHDSFLVAVCEDLDESIQLMGDCMGIVQTEGDKRALELAIKLISPIREAYCARLKATQEN